MNAYLWMYSRLISYLIVLVMLLSSITDSVSLGVCIFGFFALIFGRLSLSMLFLALYAYVSLGEGLTVGIGRTALMFVATAFIVISANLKCPRCFEGLPTQRRVPFPINWKPSDYCTVCGRNSRKVWPFQYARYPEAWDGQYIDEGGGPAQEDALLDWRRYLRAKSAIKRYTKIKSRKP